MEIDKWSSKKSLLMCFFFLNFVVAFVFFKQFQSRSMFAFLRNKYPSPLNASWIVTKGKSPDCETIAVSGKPIKALYKEALYALAILKNSSANSTTKNNTALSSFPQFQRFVSRLQTMMEVNNKENKKYLDRLQVTAQQRINDLQKPVNCKTIRKLVCQVKIKCGMGCLLHHLGICLFVALGTNRSMVLNFTVNAFEDYNEVFVPVARPCLLENTFKATEWLGELEENATSYDVPLVSLTLFKAFDPATVFAPFTIPTGFIKLLPQLHEEPDVWWVGQIMKYLTRIQPPILQLIKKTKAKTGFSHPIVGLHIRRTDKWREAKLYKIDQYMSHAINWYDQYDFRKDTKAIRQIYVATDDPAIIPALERRFSNYTFLFDPQIKKYSLRSVRERHTKDGLVETITDVKLLSECNYFVGTFSSNVGRLVYELMQADGDRTFDAFSLDHDIHYMGGHRHSFEAVADHYPLFGEIELKVGDRIGVDIETFGTHIGFGLNMRTWKYGAYPKYKVERVLLSVSYPGI